MKSVGGKSVFGIALLAGLAIALAQPAYTRLTQPPAVKINRLTDGIYITEQVMPEQVSRLHRDGFARIIDLRPDGEVPGQPSAEAIRSAAQQNNIAFDYVPVPHGAIPGAAVTSLEKALASGDRPILLYCRSGRRAARTWALVEASRPGGQGTDAIIAAVKAGGQAADDLHDEIERRIAGRPATKGSQP